MLFSTIPSPIDPQQRDRTVDSPVHKGSPRSGARFDSYESIASQQTVRSAAGAARELVSDLQGANRNLWLYCCVVYVLIAAYSYSSEAPFAHRTGVLTLFFASACLLAVLVPATGPRGQRIFLLPGVGLSTMLLLPPITATLPVLLANAAHAATRETAAARRIVLLRGNWIFLATLIGGLALRVHAAGHRPLVRDAVVAIVFYLAVYIAGRRTDLAVARSDSAMSRLQSWYRLECLALLACTPVALLMFAGYEHVGLVGAEYGAALLAVLALAAHYGFEVSMLREQVNAMEKISAVTLLQTTPARVVERFLQLSSKLVPCDRSSLWLTDASQTLMEIAARHPNRYEEASAHAPDTVRFGEGLIGRVADSQQPLIVRDGANDPRFSHIEASLRQELPYSVLLLPLVAAGETVGVFQFERDAPQSYGRRDIARVQPLASQTAATIANVRAHQDVYTQSVTDALTGLYNRRHMQAVLSDERRRAERYARSLSIAMLDVDGFKKYNDMYGHPMGDVLLKELSDLLRENVRTVDVVGRYGGEEFIVVMPETSKQEAYRTAERLRTAVAATVFAAGSSAAARKTISLGVATFPDDAYDAQLLVSKADQALYDAKNRGRNRTVLATSDPPHTDLASV